MTKKQKTGSESEDLGANVTVGPEGPIGPMGPGPTEEQIQNAVDNWMTGSYKNELEFLSRGQAIFMDILFARLDLSRTYDKWMRGKINRDQLIETMRVRVENFASFADLPPSEYLAKTAEFAQVIASLF